MNWKKEKWKENMKALQEIGIFFVVPNLPMNALKIGDGKVGNNGQNG